MEGLPPNVASRSWTEPDDTTELSDMKVDDWDNVEPVLIEWWRSPERHRQNWKASQEWAKSKLGPSPHPPKILTVYGDDGTVVASSTQNPPPTLQELAWRQVTDKNSLPEEVQSSTFSRSPGVWDPVRQGIATPSRVRIPAAPKKDVPSMLLRVGNSLGRSDYVPDTWRLASTPGYPATMRVDPRIHPWVNPEVTIPAGVGASNWTESDLITERDWVDSARRVHDLRYEYDNAGYEWANDPRTNPDISILL